jgi:hypothetical protein
MKRIFSLASIGSLALVMTAPGFTQTPAAPCCQHKAACCQHGACCHKIAAAKPAAVSVIPGKH